jgi:hypothetical protein
MKGSRFERTLFAQQFVVAVKASTACSAAARNGTEAARSSFRQLRPACHDRHTGSTSKEKELKPLHPVKRMLGGLLGLAVAVGLGVTVGVGSEVAATPEPAQASIIGGTITRAEILDRAQYWVDQGHTYDMEGVHVAGPDGKTYRRDCSGLVSMAWRLDHSYVTGDFMKSSADWDHLPSLHDLKPGDAFVNGAHMELFSHWKNNNDHTQGAYVYSFNDRGETVQNPYSDNNVGYRGFNSWGDLNNYAPIRRKNVVDSTSTPSNRYIYTLESGVLQETFGGPSGWQKNQVVSGSASTVSATWSPNGRRYIYTLENGALYEVYGSDSGWVKTRVISTAATAVSATWGPNGNRYLYILENGGLYEVYGSPTGWQKTLVSSTTATEVSATWGPNGNRYLYTLENGALYEIYGSPTGWQKTRIISTAATEVSATWGPNGNRYIYILENGALYEVYGSPTGWQKTPVISTTATEVSATWGPNGNRYIYIVENGGVYEVYGGTGWQKTRVGYGTSTAVSATWSTS